MGASDRRWCSCRRAQPISRGTSPSASRHPIPRTSNRYITFCSTEQRSSLGFKMQPYNRNSNPFSSILNSSAIGRLPIHAETPPVRQNTSDRLTPSDHLLTYISRSSNFKDYFGIEPLMAQHQLVCLTAMTYHVTLAAEPTYIQILRIQSSIRSHLIRSI